MPYGTVNADVIQSSVANTSLGAGNASIMKNRIINGAMVINQRATAVTATGYTVDRFKYTGSQSSKATVSQDTSVYPAGFNASLKVLSSSAYSVAAGDFFFLSQVIEGYNIADLGWGTANAKTVTLSFQVYSSLTGTFGGVLTNGANNRTYPFTYSVTVANTWTTISVTIAGDTTGTWATDNTAGIFVLFSLGAGSTYSGTAGSWSGSTYYSATGSTSVVGTNGATFYITGVQLEVGTSATGYEYRMYQQELALCQRYYYKSPQASNGEIFIINNANGGLTGTTCFPVSLRATPTVTYGFSTPYSGNTFSRLIDAVTVTFTLTQNNVTLARVCNLYDNASSGLTVGALYATYLTASSEL
jgi:hypothetical protein